MRAQAPLVRTLLNMLFVGEDEAQRVSALVLRI